MSSYDDYLIGLLPVTAVVVFIGVLVLLGWIGNTP